MLGSPKPVVGRLRETATPSWLLYPRTPVGARAGQAVTFLSCALRSLCGQVGYVAPVRATAPSVERSADRTPHKLSGSRIRRKPTKLASSFHGVAACLAIDSAIRPRTGSDRPIGYRAHVGRRKGQVPRPRRGGSSRRSESYVAFQIEKRLNTRHRPIGGYITILATQDAFTGNKW